MRDSTASFNSLSLDWRCCSRILIFSCRWLSSTELLVVVVVLDLDFGDGDWDLLVGDVGGFLNDDDDDVGVDAGLVFLVRVRAGVEVGEVDLDFGDDDAAAVMVLLLLLVGVVADFPAFGEMTDFFAEDLGAESLVIGFRIGVLEVPPLLDGAGDLPGVLVDLEGVLDVVPAAATDFAAMIFLGGGEMSLFLFRCSSMRL